MLATKLTSALYAQLIIDNMYAYHNHKHNLTIIIEQYIKNKPNPKHRIEFHLVEVNNQLRSVCKESSPFMVLLLTLCTLLQSW